MSVYVCARADIYILETDTARGSRLHPGVSPWKFIYAFVYMIIRFLSIYLSISLSRFRSSFYSVSGLSCEETEKSERGPRMGKIPSLFSISSAESAITSWEIYALLQLKRARARPSVFVREHQPSFSYPWINTEIHTPRCLVPRAFRYGKSPVYICRNYTGWRVQARECIYALTRLHRIYLHRIDLARRINENCIKQDVTVNPRFEGTRGNEIQLGVS